jgi:hypothetical protein
MDGPVTLPCLSGYTLTIKRLVTLLFAALSTVALDSTVRKITDAEELEKFVKERRILLILDVRKSRRRLPSSVRSRAASTSPLATSKSASPKSPATGQS